MWNNFVFPFFRTDISIGQESALSPIFSTLYILPIFQIFEKRAKNLIPSFSISFLSFIDDSLFISQKKTYEKSDTLLFYKYNIITSLLNQFGLIIKYWKSKISHFSRLTRIFNLSLLNLSLLEGY